MSNWTIENCKDFIRDTAVELGYAELVELPVYQNNRLRTTLGRAKGQDDFFFIEISGKMLIENTDEDVRQVCLHELCHILCWIDFGYNTKPHGKEFKYECVRVGCTHKGYENEVERDAAAPPEVLGKYVLKCTCCGNEWRFKTKCKRIQNPGDYWCKSCGELKGKLISFKL